MLSSVLSPIVSNAQTMSLVGGSMNAGQSYIVSWNPNTSNWFSVIAGRDVYYYKIDERVLSNVLEQKSTPNTNISQEFSSISTTSLQSEALCYSWSPENKETFAVGLSNGSILLDDIQSDQHVFAEFTRTDPANRGKTSSPPCRCIDWNPVETNYIAAGYDKVPKQNCVAIWDLSRITSGGFSGIISDTESTISSDYGGLSSLHHGTFVSNSVKKQSNTFQLPSRSYFTTKIVTRPLYELCPGEGATSISWMPNQSNIFLLGTSLKYIRLFDLRDSLAMKSCKPSKSFAVHNKSVLGIHFNPFDSNQFATYSEESVVRIWDMRKMPNPIKELNVASLFPASSQKTPPTISQVQWSTSHKNVLGVLTKDSNSIKLCDLAEQAKTVKYKISNYQTVFSSNNSPITSFSFHPNIPKCILLSTYTGFVQYTFLKDFTKFSISCHEEIISAHNNQIVENSFIQPNDIISVMKERAKRAIGLDLKHNIAVSTSLKDIDGIIIWSWIHKMRELNKMNGRNQPNEQFYIGIQTILDSSMLLQNLTGQDDSTFLPFKPLTGTVSHNFKGNTISPHSEIVKHSSTTRYHSPQRSICLHVCGWDQEYLNALKSSQVPPEYLNERSVAIAIFNMDIKAAANILGVLSDNDKKSNYMFLAYALGGYSESRREEFHNVFNNLYPKLNDPYLSAAFGFLTSSEPKDVECVLEQKAIPVSDRIAFACYYLNDFDLGKYILSLKEKGLATGDIQGLLLTGLQSNESYQLMQKYVDRTGDVQTACLVFNRALTTKNNNSIADIWMENYRDLLDRWKMWEERAFLDISIQQSLRGESVISHEGATPTQSSVNTFSGTAPILQASVSIKCAFCSQSLHHSSLLSSKGGRQAQLANKHGNNLSMPKTTSCPSCRKPLPKCAVCLMAFGSPSHSMGGNSSSEMDFCFSWCTRCKHGGHVKHLLDWFENHEECPVSDCKCKCFSYL
nr:unnamed protein product [Naegleria fowleri]